MLLQQRIANGDGEGIPKGLTSLIKVPADISKSLRESLEGQAETWIDRNQRLPAAIQQLLKRQPLPALKALNTELKGDPERVGELLTAFLARNSGITLALQGPPDMSILKDAVDKIVEAYWGIRDRIK